jgi:hypothetical protein
MAPLQGFAVRVSSSECGRVAAVPDDLWSIREAKADDGAFMTDMLAEELRSEAVPLRGLPDSRLQRQGLRQDGQAPLTTHPPALSGT